MVRCCENHLEYTKPGGNTHYIISGSASEARKASVNPTGGLFAASEQGFATFSISRNRALLQFINYDGKIIYNTVLNRNIK